MIDRYTRSNAGDSIHLVDTTCSTGTRFWRSIAEAITPLRLRLSKKPLIQGRDVRETLSWDGQYRLKARFANMPKFYQVKMAEIDMVVPEAQRPTALCVLDLQGQQISVDSPMLTALEDQPSAKNPSPPLQLVQLPSGERNSMSPHLYASENIFVF